jgi:adenosylhomocysteine nucleosidase
MKIGIVAALEGELRPLVRGWSREGKLHHGKIGSAECVAIAAGMGASAATRGVEQLFAAAPALDALISIGWAGALVNELRAPSAVIIGEVVESRTGERYTLEPGGPTLVTTDRMIPQHEKHALGARYRASLVDMEAATVARLARSRGVRFLSVKAISDDADTRLPDFNRFTNSAGTLKLPALLAHVIVRPGSWGALMLLGINSKRAAEALADEVPQCLRGAGLVS